MNYATCGYDLHPRSHLISGRGLSASGFQSAALLHLAVTIVTVQISFSMDDSINLTRRWVREGINWKVRAQTLKHLYRPSHPAAQQRRECGETPQDGWGGWSQTKANRNQEGNSENWSKLQLGCKEYCISRNSEVPHWKEAWQWVALTTDLHGCNLSSHFKSLSTV